MTKRTWRVLFSTLAIFAILAIAAACGDDDDDDTTPDTGGTTSVAPSGTITIAAVQFETWDPHFSDFAQDIAHFMMVWRGLYHLDLADKPLPAMAAAAPQVSTDGKTYTVKIKPGLLWSDGKPLDANDFVLGIQRTCNPDVAGHYQYILTAIVGCDAYYAAAKETPAKKDELLKAVGVRAVDALTLEVKLSDAQPTFGTILSMWPTFPAPKHLILSVDQKWPGPLEVVYNGPYVVKSYTEKASMELSPNPNWSGAAKPKVAKIVLKYIDDSAVANNAYRTGELDATLANKPELDRLKTAFPDELYLYPGTRTTAILFQMKDPTLAKADVRLALSQATDRVTLVRVVYQNANIVSTSWIPPARNGLKGGEYDSILGFNVASAKAHLAKAGYPDGKDFPELSLVLVDSATNKLLGDFLYAEWNKHLNIKIKLQYVDSKTRSSLFNAKTFQLLTGGWQEDYPDAENWMLGLMQTGSSINKEDISIPALDAIIKAAQFNTNDEQRRQQYRDGEKLLLQEASGYAPMFHTLVAMLVKPTIKGMVENKRPGDTFVPGDWYPELWSTTKK